MIALGRIKATVQTAIRIPVFYRRVMDVDLQTRMEVMEKFG